MIDYSKLKVTELKEELRNRNLPLTKLKVKQDFIEKLLAADAADEASNSPAAVAGGGDKAASVSDGAGHEQESAVVAREKAWPSQKDESEEHQLAKGSAQAPIGGLEKSTATEHDEPREKTVVDGDSQALLATESPDTTMKPALPPTPTDDRASEPLSQQNATSVDVPDASSTQPTEQRTPHSSPDRANTSQAQSVPPSYRSTPSSGPVPSLELLEDSRKRKRRSVTPPPSTIEMAQKKAKASDGSPRVTQKEGSILVEASQPQKDIEVSINGREIQESASEEAPQVEHGPLSAPQIEATDPHQSAGRRTSPSRSPAQRTSLHKEDEQPSLPKQEDQHSPLLSPVRSRPRSPTPLQRRSPSPPKPLVSGDRLVSPARHPATSSLYIRNFKRPLHLPSLRSHISAVATSPNTDAGKDSIASFYLDGVRTHGFVSFISITAASRARSALHNSRFPDEKTREPLWVDFVPDEKVEEWIETEQRANGGARVGRRWEVVYQDSPDGIEAILQEVGSGSGVGFAPQRRPSGPMGRREPEIAAGNSNAPGVHPERARLLPSEDNIPQRKQSSLQQEPRPEQSGTGFRALDDLFPSTTAKPKLYYKPVDTQIAEERLDMIRDLGNLAGAKSGDPDMKRYSLELDRGREEWVDKGPEFGYGARGRGFERGGRGGRGGYRGRGGTGRGSDTWRSGGRY